MSRLPSYPILPGSASTATPVVAPSSGASGGGRSGGNALNFSSTPLYGTGGTGGLSVSRNSANAAAKRAIEYQQQSSAEGWSPGIPYGTVFVGAKILAWKVVGDKLYLSAGWCLGEVSAIVEIYESNSPLDNAVTVTNYLGTTTQIADTTLSGVIAGYADTNVFSQHGQSVGICYSVLVFPAKTTTRFPQLTAKINGLKVNAGAWTDNPARFLADFLSNSVYGMGVSVNAASITAAAAWCDEDVSGEKRVTAGLILDTPKRGEEWVEVLRQYALCFVVRDGDEVLLIPDKPGSSVRSIAASGIVADSMRLSKRSLQSAPTVVTVRYTATDQLPWRDAKATAQLPGVDTGSVAFRESEVALPGLQTYGAALRVAKTRLNAHTLVDLDASWTSYDDQLDIQIGDIVDVTHPFGLTAKLMRVVSVRPGARAGLWEISAAEHDDNIYSDDVAATGSMADSSLPNPNAPPAVDAVTLTEQIFEDQAGRIRSQFTVTWTGVDWPFAAFYRVRVTGGNLSVSAAEVHLGVEEHTFPTPAVKQGTQYEAKVYTISTTGKRSTASTATATAQGRLIPPGQVTGLTGFEGGDFISLSWNSVADIGIVKYRIRRGETTDTWSTATTPPGGQLVAATFFLDRTLDDGTYRYFVKAVDDVGIESDIAAYVDIVVVNDIPGGYLQQEAGGTGGTLTNMHRYLIDGDARYVVTDQGDSWADRFGVSPGTWTGTLWFEGHSLAAGDASFVSAQWDIGSDRNGTISYNAIVDLLGAGAVATKKILTATAAAHPTFTEYSGSAVKGIVRYEKIKIVDDSGASTRGIKIKFPVTQQFVGETSTQSGTVLIPAAGQPKVITFSPPYLTTPRIQVTSENATPRIISVNNKSATGFDLYAWNTSGAVAGSIAFWEAIGS